MYLINADDISIEDKKRYKIAAIEAGRQRGLAMGLARQEAELIAAEFEPKNFGLETWQTKPLTAGTVFNWIQHDISSYCVYVLCKIFCGSLSPGARAITFMVGHSGATVRAVLQLHECYAGLPSFNKFFSMVGGDAAEVMGRLMGREEKKNNIFLGRSAAYLTEPIVYDPADHIWVSLEVERNSPEGDWIILSGFRIERFGMTIM